LRLQLALDALLRLGGDRLAILARDLQRRVRAEQVRQGEQARQQQHRADEDVFPAGVLEHGLRRP
jgi:hypothetical protein